MRWETEQPFGGQLCREYVYQKLLKLDNPSSSYGKKLYVFEPHSVVTNNLVGLIMMIDDGVSGSVILLLVSVIIFYFLRRIVGDDNY